MAERTESVIIDVEIDEGEAVESIQSLTKANKELREERNKLNLSTEAGRKRAQEINAVLDQNTNKIKANVSALEKQKINIGNYASALDNVIPGLSGIIDKGASATKTITGMSLATKLLLGPIGLLILAGTAIVKFLTGSEEGMDKLAVVMAKVSAVVNVVTDRLIQLGGALIKFLSGDFSGGIDGIKSSFSGMGDEMQREIDLAVDLAERLDILDDLNVSLNIRLSEQQNEIKNLIIQSRNRFISEEKAMNLLIQASQIEKRLTGERLALRLAEINAIASEIQLRNSEKQAIQQAGETSIEFAKRIALDTRILLSDRQKIVEQLDKYNGLLDNQANIQEKIQTQQDALTEKIRANQKEQEELRRAAERANNEIQRSSKDGVERQDREDPLIDAFETRANVITDIDKRMQDDRVKRNEETDAMILANRKKTAKIEEEIEREKMQAVTGFLANTSQIFEQESVAGKAIASAQALINTYLAATAALASGSKINPIFGIISAAAAVAAGLASVARINGVEFAEGGWTGPGSKYQPVGIVHADEYVVNKKINNSPQAQPHIQALENMRLRGYADGGYVSGAVTQPINQQMELANMFKNLPPIEVGVKEITKVQNRVRVKETISRR